MRQIIQVKGIDRETAAYGAQVFSRLNSGSSPTNADRRAGAVLTETGKTEAKPKQDVYAVPSYGARQFLASHPETADQYDAMFGPGAAKLVLGADTASHYHVPEGTVDIAPDGTESFTPNGTKPKAKAEEKKDVIPDAPPILLLGP
jgi:hypothetical protein